jgi:hypothetical protein
MSEDNVRVVALDDGEHESGGQSGPPIWAAVLVGLAAVGAGWLFVSQRSTDGDSITSSTYSFTASTLSSVTPDDVPEDTPTVSTPEADSEIRVGFPDLYPRVAVDAPGFGPGDLEAEVVLMAPSSAGLWVFGPDGGIVSRRDVPITPGPRPYPVLITAGSIVFSNFGLAYVLDPDLAEPATQFASATFVIPGGKEGVVWFVGSRSLTDDIIWVAPVDVAAQTVGERIMIGDVFSEIVTGVADGLLVRPLDEEASGLYAYWSPSGELARLVRPMALSETVARSIPSETVLSASGNLAILVFGDRVSVVDYQRNVQVGQFFYDLGGSVGSACLAPDLEHVVVVGSNGNAFIGNVDTGELIALDSDVQPSHGVAWTSNDQLVYLRVSENGRTLVTHGADESGGGIALLDGAGEWWLTASGTMC